MKRVVFNLTKKGNLTVKNCKVVGKEWYTISSYTFRTPISCWSPKVKGKKKQKRKGTFPLGLVLHMYKKACSTPIEKWNGSMAAVYFWMSKQDIQRMKLTHKLVKPGEIPKAYKLFALKEFRDLAKSNPVLARLFSCRLHTIRNLSQQN